VKLVSLPAFLITAFSLLTPILVSAQTALVWAFFCLLFVVCCLLFVVWYESEPYLPLFTTTNYNLNSATVSLYAVIFS
ncbi:hypothetical protein AB6C98_17915, partial [Vibrio splendidus]